MTLGCGPRTGSASDETTTSTSTTGQAVSEPQWTWGGGATPVVSSPVSAPDGSLHALVGVDAELLPEAQRSFTAHYEAGGLGLVSLTPEGELRWITQLVDEELVLRHQLMSPPSIGVGGDVWVCHASKLMRVTADGSVAWTADEACGSSSRGTALGGDGSHYAIVTVFLPSGQLRTDLVATAPDGTDAWRIELGLPYSSGEDGLGTEVGGLALDQSGQVVVGCDTCSEGAASIARLDPDTGEVLAVASIEGVLPPTSYSAVVVDEGGAWFGTRFWERLWRWSFVDTEVQEMPNTSTPLVYAGGLVGFTDAQSGLLEWGATSLDPQQSWGWTAEQIGALAVLEPMALLLGHGKPYDPVRGCSEDDDGCSLVIVDGQGSQVWTRDDVAPGRLVPAIQDGALVYVDSDHRMLAVEASVSGVAPGPWPMVGATLQHTHAAR